MRVRFPPCAPKIKSRLVLGFIFGYDNVMELNPHAVRAKRSLANIPALRTKSAQIRKRSPCRAAFSVAARSACQRFFRGEIRNCHAYGVVLFVCRRSRRAPRPQRDILVSGKQFKAYAIFVGLNGYFATIWRMLNCFPSGVAF